MLGSTLVVMTKVGISWFLGLPVSRWLVVSFHLLEGTSVTLPCNQTSVPEADFIWKRLLLDQDSNESQTIPVTGSVWDQPMN